MFEVDGFKSLYEIRRKFRFENLYFNDQNYIMSRFHPGELRELDMTWDAYDKYEHAAVSYCDGSFGKFLHTVQSFFLMDSDGNAKPVTRAIFSAPIEGNRNYLYLSDRFMCVDIEAEMAAINAARVIINNKSRFNLTFGTIRELSRMAELEPALRRMLPFQGHAVFIRAEEAPDDTAIRTMLGLPAEDDGSACDDDIDAPGGLSDRGGRPSKRQEILNAYSQAFPEGRSPRPWKEIFQAVREQGIDASDVTIKRALKATGDSA